MAKNDKKRVAIGTDNFRKTVEENDIFVDKSLFIKEVIESSEEAILITRPRRWGKTLNLDMLKQFLALEIDEKGKVKDVNSHRVLFEGGEIEVDFNSKKNLSKLAIATVDDGKYMNYQGQYPVIFMSLKDVVGSSIEEIESKLKIVVGNLFKEHRYLISNNNFAADEVDYFNKVINGDISRGHLEQSIKFITELLYRYHNKRVYILIDEYDKPANQLIETLIANDEHKELVNEASKLVTYIFSSCGKSNPYLQKIIITGIFDNLKKEGGSGFNNVNVFGVIDARYSNHFGFSEEEVDKLIKNLGFKEKTELVKQNIQDWYNGYNVPVNSTYKMKIFTPWAVMNYLNNAYNYNNFVPENYWAKTGASVILQKLLNAGSINHQLIEKFNAIAEVNSVKLAFDKSTSLFKYEPTNEKYITYLLVNSGYLTVNEKDGEYWFNIPDYEVKKEFLDVIDSKIQSLGQQNQFAMGISELGKLREYVKVLSNTLNKFSHNHRTFEVIKAIMDKDNVALSRIFNTDKLVTCEEHDNFFTFAAIAGDTAVFKTLLSKCDKKHLSDKDKLTGLRPIDYAVMLHNEEIKAILQDNGQVFKDIYTPNLFSYVYCNPYTPFMMTMGTASITGGLKYLGKSENIPIISGPLAIFTVVDFAILNAKYAKQYIDFKICESYQYYNTIEPRSLLGFKKYIQEHLGSYVSLDSQCNDNEHKSIASTSPFSGHHNYELEFYLCVPYGTNSDLYVNKDL